MTIADPTGVECEDAELVMAAREARTLTSREEAQFLEHLATCERCRQTSQTTSEDEWRWLARVPQEMFGDADGLLLPTIDPGVFEVERELATGGMGRILLARDRRLGRMVAIKEVLDRDLHARFEREALITARLQHPAIVPIYEAGMWPDGSGFYTMRLVPGGTLQTAIGTAKLLSERLALLHHVVAMTEAVAYAHGHRIIHRDLKPSNVLVGDLGETVVIDWGLAKELDGPELDVVGARVAHSSDLTRVGAVMGTPGFMAPEQARGETIDERADVYALGSILYSLLAGVPPYAEELAGNPDDLVAIGAARPPRSIDELAPDAPADLRAIVHRAMARAPAARYPTAREMAEELRRFEAGKLLARQYGVRELIGRWIRRHRAVVSVAVLALVVVIVVSALAVVNVTRSRTAEQVARAAAERDRGLTKASFEEQGRSAVIGGELDRGLVYLSEALSRGYDTPALRHLLAVATRDRDLQKTELEPLPGYVLDIAFLADGQVAVVEETEKFGVSTTHGQLTLWKDGVQTYRQALGVGLASAVFNAGGTTLVVVGVDHALALWNVTNGTRQWFHKSVASEDVTHVVRFDAAGTRVVFANRDDSRVRVHDAATGVTLATLELGSGTINDVAFSPDGKWLAASGNGGEIQIWSASTYAPFTSWKAAIPQRKLVFADALHVLTHGKKDVSLWTLDQKLAWTVSHDHDIADLAVDSRGELIASSDTGGVVRTWTPNGQSAGISHARTKVRDLRFSPDGALLLGGSSGEQLYVWDTTALDVVKSYTLDTVAIEWSVDGALFATGTTDNVAQVWARPMGNQRAAFASATSIFAGNQVFAKDKDGLVLRARETGAEVARMSAPRGNELRGAWHMSRDGRRLVDYSEDKDQATIIDLPSGRQIATFVTDEVHLSRNGQRVALFDFFTVKDSRVRIVDATTGNVIADRAYATDEPIFVALSPDGRELVVSHKGRPWEIWDTDTLSVRRVIVGSTEATEAAYDPVGRVVLYGRDDFKVTVHHATTGVVIAALRTSMDIERVETGDTGDQLAFEYENGVVEVYTLGRAQPRARIRDIAKGAFALTPDGARLATGHNGGEIRIWETETGRLLEVLRGHRRKIASLEFSADGTFLLADGAKEPATVWELALDGRTPAEIARVAEQTPWKLVDGVLVPR